MGLAALPRWLTPAVVLWCVFAGWLPRLVHVVHEGRLPVHASGKQEDEEEKRLVLTTYPADRAVSFVSNLIVT